MNCAFDISLQIDSRAHCLRMFANNTWSWLKDLIIEPDNEIMILIEALSIITILPSVITVSWL